VGVAADALLQRRDRAVQLLVGPRSHPQFECGDEQRAGEVLGQQVQHRPGAPTTPRQRRGPLEQPLAAARPHVLDGGHDQVGLGREVVQLGAAGHPGPARDQCGGGTRPAAFDQALDRRLQQPLAHGAAALLLRHARDRRLGHEASMGAFKQTVKPACLSL
jgi:hypothetical protein